VYFCVFAGASLFVLGLVFRILCISSLLLLDCQYLCNQLPGKTRLRNDLLRIEPLTQSLKWDMIYWFGQLWWSGAM